MEKFILGVGVAIAFFGLIHIRESIRKPNDNDLKEEEKKWLKGK